MNICVLDGYTLNPGDLDWNILEEFGNIKIYDQTYIEEIISRAECADILIVNKIPITEKIVSNLPNLKYLIVSATGYNNIDVEAFKRRNIPISNIVNYGSDAVAQHTFALILALTNKVYEHNQAIIEGQWGQTSNFCFWNSPLSELKDKKLGIIGMGSIGNKVAEIGKAFGMKVLYFSKSKKRCAFGTSTKIEKLLSESDIITIHTHLSNENEKFINSNFLKKLKKSAFLINTSRGKLIDEKDLAFALQNEIIAGAGLDTLSEEPAKTTNPLIGLKNCIITPHIAWAPQETRARMLQIIANCINSFQNGIIRNRIV